MCMCVCVCICACVCVCMFMCVSYTVTYRGDSYSSLHITNLAMHFLWALFHNVIFV